MCTRPRPRSRGRCAKASSTSANRPRPARHRRRPRQRTRCPTEHAACGLGYRVPPIVAACRAWPRQRRRSRRRGVGKSTLLRKIESLEHDAENDVVFVDIETLRDRPYARRADRAARRPQGRAQARGLVSARSACHGFPGTETASETHGHPSPPARPATGSATDGARTPISRCGHVCRRADWVPSIWPTA